MGLTSAMLPQGEASRALWLPLQLAPLHAALPLSSLFWSPGLRGGEQEILEAIFGVVKLSLNVQVEHPPVRPPPSLLFTPHSFAHFSANLVRKSQTLHAGDKSTVWLCY